MVVFGMLEQQPLKESSMVLLSYDEINRYEQYVTVKKRWWKRHLPPEFNLLFLAELDISGSFVNFLVKINRFLVSSNILLKAGTKKIFCPNRIIL